MAFDRSFIRVNWWLKSGVRMRVCEKVKQGTTEAALSSGTLFVRAAGRVCGTGATLCVLREKKEGVVNVCLE